MKDTPEPDSTSSAPAKNQVVAHPSRVELEPDSPYSAAFSVYSECDRAQIAALETTARLFFADVVEHLGLVNAHPDEPYQHATLTETALRHRRARLGEAIDGNAGTESSPDDDTSVDGEPSEVPTHFVADDAAGLPGFPRFREDQTIDGWVHLYSHSEDIAELSAIRGSTIGRTVAHVVSAMTFVHGLPKFHARCLAGDFTIEHIQAATHLCKDLAFSKLTFIDAYLAERRANITIETFKKSLSMRIAVLKPSEDRTKDAHEHRRVGITTYPDGTACLTLTGPAADLQALYVRIEAFARTIRNGNTAALADQLPGGAVIDDVRTIDALMFDIFTRTVPQLSIQVRAHDTDTGETTTHEIPLNLDDVQTGDDIAEAITTAAESVAGAADDSTPVTEDEPSSGASTHTGFPTGIGTGTEASGETAVNVGLAGGVRGTRLERIPGVERDEQGRVLFTLGVFMPTKEFWMGGQAKVITTVPCTTLSGHSELPGTFSDGSPVPAETARYIASHSKTWTRILTDPATGTPIDARATTYQIPASIRQTLVAQWRGCSVPGCRRRAETSEIDHITPFDHDNPEAGGLTVFGNLHPLCRRHHQAKTDGRYHVRMDYPGVLEYRFAHGTTATVCPPDHPVNAENARLMQHPGTADPPSPSRSASDSASDPDRDSGSTSSASQPASSTDPVPDDPRPGDVRFSEECPGPEGGIGSAGWVRSRRRRRGSDPRKQRWVWDNGEPPPF